MDSFQPNALVWNLLHDLPVQSVEHAYGSGRETVLPIIFLPPITDGTFLVAVEINACDAWFIAFC